MSNLIYSHLCSLRYAAPPSHILLLRTVALMLALVLPSVPLFSDEPGKPANHGANRAVSMLVSSFPDRVLTFISPEP